MNSKFQLLHRQTGGKFTEVLTAAVYGLSYLKTREIESLDVAKLSEEITNEPLPMNVQTELLNGLLKIYKKKTANLMSDMSKKPSQASASASASTSAAVGKRRSSRTRKRQDRKRRSQLKVIEQEPCEEEYDVPTKKFTQLQSKILKKIKHWDFFKSEMSVEQACPRPITRRRVAQCFGAILELVKQQYIGSIELGSIEKGTKFNEIRDYL